MKEAERIGACLRQLRREKSAAEQRDVTQEEIARAVGVTEETYSRYEGGKRTPKTPILDAIAAYWKVKPGDLRYYEPPAARMGVASFRPARISADEDEKKKGA